METLPVPRDLVGRLYETTAAGGDLTLASFAEACGGTYGLFFGANAVGGGIDEASCHGVDLGYVHRLKEASKEHMLPPWLAELAPGSVFDRAAFGSDQAFGRTAFYNHVIRPEGRFHCMIATPYVSRRHRFHLVVGRPRHKAEFDADDRRLLQAMLPHVSEVVRLRDELAVARAAAQRTEGVLDSLPMQMVTVTLDAFIAFATRGARRCLSLRNGIHVDSKGRLVAASPRDTAILHRTILAVSADRDGPPVSLQLPRLAGGAPIALIVSPVEQPQIGQDHQIAAMITIENRNETAARDLAANLARSHGLTRREAALATSLASGQSLANASVELGMSYNTARSYLRQIFQKLEVHRQGDLIRLLTTGLRPQL